MERRDFLKSAVAMATVAAAGTAMTNMIAAIMIYAAFFGKT